MTTTPRLTLSLLGRARLAIAAAVVALFLGVVVVGTLRFLQWERHRLTMPLSAPIAVPVLDRERLSTFAGRLAR